MMYKYLTILLLLFTLNLSAQEMVMEYDYYPAYGNLEKKAYRLLNQYTQKELNRRPYGREVTEVIHFMNESFAQLAVPVYAQQGDRKAVKKRVRAIELVIKKYGPDFSTKRLQECFYELNGQQTKRKSRSTKRKFVYHYNPDVDAYATK